MSDQTDSTEQEDSTEGQKPNWRRDLENRATTAETEAQTLKSQLQSLQRESAFRGAGLDPANKLHALLMKSYDGELDSDKIRTEAEEAGVLTVQETPATQGNIAAHDRMDRASLGAQPVQPTGSNDDKLGKILGAQTQDEYFAQVKAAGWMAN